MERDKNEKVCDFTLFLLRLFYEPPNFFKTRDAPKRVALTSRKGIEKLREIKDRGRTFPLAESALKHS